MDSARAPEEGEWRLVLDADGRVRVRDGFVSPTEQAVLFAECLKLPWLFDKTLATRGTPQARGVCTLASPGASGQRYPSTSWGSVPLEGPLAALLGRVNDAFGADFNVWYLNQYRPNDKDHLGRHSDDESFAGRDRAGELIFVTLVLADSPACTRVVRFAKNGEPGRRVELETKSGQAYTMEGPLQRHWTHEVLAQVPATGTRISLSARRWPVAGPSSILSTSVGDPK
jgi:hypothetical protein